jgi:oligoribonuclease NrnB/cAMP/cGMP phosphodiesterase (DHH superfamily)
MIDLESLKHVYYHASCPDGTASAVIVASALSSRGLLNNVEFRSIQYGTKEHDDLVPEPGSMFVDITPPLKRWREWEGTGVAVLDHHETARDATVGLGGIYGTNDEWSGARLAYEHVFRPGAVNGFSELDDFSLLAMIRDTWKKDHPRWKEAEAQAMALSFHGPEEMLGRVARRYLDLDNLMCLGDALSKKAERSVKKYCSGASWTESNGLKVAFFNCTEKLTSDIGNALLEAGADVAVGWFSLNEDGGPKLSVSLRGNGKVSVRKIAQRRGGGGHDRAAGFRIPGVYVSHQDMVGVVTEALSAVLLEASPYELPGGETRR